MILTLAWKEFREHWSIWVTMVFMTGVLGFGLAELASRDSFTSRAAIQALTVLGMAATYGAVCGAMMFAGERESGTLVFLDVFHGKREWLWIAKVLIGIFFALSEALAVALMLHLFDEAPPGWIATIVGEGQEAIQFQLNNVGQRAVTLPLWFRVLPVVTLEAYAWGLFGSSWSRRVVSGAGLAAVLATPVWLFTVFMPPPIFLGVRLVAVAFVLILSLIIFLNESREASLGAPPPPRPDERPRARTVDGWGARYDGERRPLPARRREERRPLDVAPFVPQPRLGEIPMVLLAPRVPQAHSPLEVLWWLTFRQAWGLICILAVVGVLVGFLIPAYGQLLWPISTMFLGVACGTAAFAPEQRDLSYQFLAAQHFPLHTVWRVKVFFWMTAALLLAGVMFAGALLVLFQQNLPALRRGIEPVAGFQFGTLREVMGSALYFGVWLAYGFCMGQLLVLFCRKNVLAVLLALLFGFASVGLWLPSVLCKGLSGWQVWLPPIAFLAATRFLIRPWAGGRVKERRPLAALAGFAGIALVWAGCVFSVRAWEIAEVPPPLDREKYRERLPLEDKAGIHVQAALGEVDRRDGKIDDWLKPMVDATKLPPGIIEAPSESGNQPLLRLLPHARTLTDKLVHLARVKQTDGRPDAAFDHLAQILALSRTLRFKAPPDFYLSGVLAEKAALDQLDVLAQAKPAPALLRRILAELDRHDSLTPAPLDCVETECYRTEGALNNAATWSFYSGDGHIRERWLAGWIALSFEAPWEEQRAVRLWREVWDGLIRAARTPAWERPQHPETIISSNEKTRAILRGWIPGKDGSGASTSAQDLARLLDASWMADNRLFIDVVPLLTAGTRAKWRVESRRLATAAQLYQADHGKPPADLNALAPKYLPELPVDPYSGKPFQYRVSKGEQIAIPGAKDEEPETCAVARGQAVLWSTGPDRTDNGGSKHGAALADEDPRWEREGCDLVTVVPGPG